MWIEREVMPMLREALERDGLQSSLTLAGLERNKLLFNYSPIKRGMGYTAASVQLEFGGRTTGEPHQRHAVVCDMAQAIPEIGFPTAQPLVLAAERTFWEKATILHAEFHRPADKPMKDRHARHYADFKALWRHELAKDARRRLDLLDRVRAHKSRFFSSSWANYALAVPGIGGARTLRLSGHGIS